MQCQRALVSASRLARGVDYMNKKRCCSYNSFTTQSALCIRLRHGNNALPWTQKSGLSSSSRRPSFSSSPSRTLSRTVASADILGVLLHSAKISFALFLTLSLATTGVWYFLFPYRDKYLAQLQELLTILDSHGALPADNRYPHLLNLLVLVRAQTEAEDGWRVRKSSEEKSSDNKDSSVSPASSTTLLSEGRTFCRIANAIYPAEVLVALGLLPVTDAALCSRVGIIEKYVSAGGQSHKIFELCHLDAEASPTDRFLGRSPFQPAAFVGVHHGFRAVVVAIRGTTTLHDIFADLMADSVRVPFVGHDGASSTTEVYAHEGMLRSSRNLLNSHNDAIISALKESGYKRVVFTGHSLGGGCAQLCAYLFRTDMEIKTSEQKGTLHSVKQVDCFAFGAPPVICDTSPSNVSPIPVGRGTEARDEFHTFCYGNDIVCSLSMGTVLDLVHKLESIDRQLSWGYIRRLAYVVAGSSGSEKFLRELGIFSEATLPMRCKSGASSDSDELPIPARFCLRHIGKVWDIDPKISLGDDEDHKSIDVVTPRQDKNSGPKQEQQLCISLAGQHDVFLDHLPSRYEDGLKCAFDQMNRKERPQATPTKPTL
ncbi:unnamed protein product [Amoebophrya sp. A25]|nr:unnamed protein product [Amoebophrya sp. A25]|eukprot:GSA25T00018224001.1